MNASLRLSMVLLTLLELAAFTSIPLQAHAHISRSSAPTSEPSLTRGQQLEARLRYRRSRRSYRFPRWGAPAWSTGGAARGGCSSQEAPLVPLMPITDTGKAPTFFGVTVSERPTFFAYLPQTRARHVEFLLVDEEAGTVVYQKRIAVTGNPQVVSFNLEATTAPLIIGRNYKWSFATICNLKDRAIDASGNPFIAGLIQRIEPSPALASRLTQTQWRDRPNLYAEEGAWLDSLTALAQLRCSNPDDRSIASDWATLLQAMELEKIPALSKLIGQERLDQAPLTQCSAQVGTPLRVLQQVALKPFANLESVRQLPAWRSGGSQSRLASDRIPRAVDLL